MKNLMINLSVLLILFILTSPLYAADLTGQEILEKMDQILQVKSSNFQVTMTIINEDGQQRERTIEILTKDKNALVKFLAPSDVKGTALLLVQAQGQTDMWLYLPALGSSRKVASHMQNGSFMGTDFTYQDFNMFGKETYQKNYQSSQVSSELYEGVACYILDTVPTSQDSNYSRIRIWVNKENFMALKLEFFDKQGNPLKIMTNMNIQNIDGHITPTKIQMQNLQLKTKTILELVEVKYDQNLPDNIFTTRYMEKN